MKKKRKNGVPGGRGGEKQFFFSFHRWKTFSFQPILSAGSNGGTPTRGFVGDTSAIFFLFLFSFQD